MAERPIDANSEDDSEWTIDPFEKLSFVESAVRSRSTFHGERVDSERLLELPVEELTRV